MEEAADLAAADREQSKDDVVDAADREQGKDDGVDAAGRLTCEIFSLLESKFLFGCDVPAGLFPTAAAVATGTARPAGSTGKVCVLSIDGGPRAADGLLAGAALVRLEAALRRRAGIPGSRLADFFDVAAGSGAGGVLAALLFARGPRGRPMCTADEALAFLLRRVTRRRRSAPGLGQLVFASRRGISFSSAGGGAAAFGRALGDLTLRDTVRSVLVPCYDLVTRAPFLFSRADAAMSAAHDFRLRDVCAATCTAGGAGGVVEVVSVDGATRIRAVGGGVALGNPTAAAITHVLNNRREFPAAATIDDLLVMSIGTGAGEAGGRGRGRRAPEVASIFAEGVSDMVDQAVAMAFGHSRTTNYIRIQGTGGRCGGGGRAPRACGGQTKQEAVWKAEAMLLQRSVESVLFQGRKLAGETNADKVDRFARELAKEHARRKQLVSPGGGPPVVGASAAAPNNDKQQRTTTTTKAIGSATVAVPAVAPAEEAPSIRRRRQAATKKHAPATSRADGGSQLVRSGTR